MRTSRGREGKSGRSRDVCLRKKEREGNPQSERDMWSKRGLERTKENTQGDACRVHAAR